jgi:prephenate dehydrogenase
MRSATARKHIRQMIEPKTITIYSVGLLGGSIGAALKASGFDGRIIGLSSEKGINTALVRGLLDEGHPYSDLSTVIKQTDLLILCSPIITIINTIKELGKMELPDGLVITDIGSTKRAIVNAANEYLPPHVTFIGGHPMAGSEKSGPDASAPDLFVNAVYVLTQAGTINIIDNANNPDNVGCVNNANTVDAIDSLSAFLRKYLRCRTVVFDPATHDSVVAAVSHLPHILASALVLCAHDCERTIPGALALAAGGFRDMTRIASSKYDIWHDIFSTNKEAIIPLIDSYINILNEMKTLLANDALKNRFEEARAIKESIPVDTKSAEHQRTLKHLGISDGEDVRTIKETVAERTHFSKGHL